MRWFCQTQWSLEECAVTAFWNSRDKVIVEQLLWAKDFPGGAVVKNLPVNEGDAEVDSVPGSGRSLEEGMATYSRILAWRIPWTEEPGELQSMGSKESDMTEQLNNKHTICKVYFPFTEY